MTRRRFHALPEAFSPDQTSVTLRDDEARHLRSVLRLGPGDRVYVFDGTGREFECEVAKPKKDSVELMVVSEVEPARRESPLKLTLAVALLKGDKFDLVVQKTTELGVVSIIPVETKLADIKLRDERDADKRVQRWQRIALEAAKQTGRALVPEVERPRDFEAFAAETDECLFFSERDGVSLETAIRDIGVATALTAVVGPEGGWTDVEIEAARGNNWKIITLGGRILRAETAAIAVTTLLQHRFGDLK